MRAYEHVSLWTPGGDVIAPRECCCQLLKRESRDSTEGRFRGPQVHENKACAIVPLNPNELSRHHDVRAAPRGSAATGIRNGLDDAIDDRCAFSLG